MVVGDVAVGECTLVNTVLRNERGEVFLTDDRYAFGVHGAGQFSGILPVPDARDLGGGECNNVH